MNKQYYPAAVHLPYTALAKKVLRFPQGFPGGVCILITPPFRTNFMTDSREGTNEPLEGRIYVKLKYKKISNSDS